MHQTMTRNENRAIHDPLNAHIGIIERVMTRPANTFIFLLTRFVLMSGMVVGFSWWALNLSP